MRKKSNNQITVISLAVVIILTLCLVMFSVSDSKPDIQDKEVVSENTVSIPESNVEIDIENNVESDAEIKEQPSVSKAKRTSKNVLYYDIISASTVADDITPTPRVPVSTVSFVACGDNLIHSSIYTDAKTLAAGTGKEYNFIPMFENVLDIIEQADLAFINQETPFGGDIKPISGYPMFNTPDQVGYDLVEMGFDIIGLANNHMLDSTSAGYKRTIEFWEKQEGVTGVGGYKNKEDYENIRIVEKNGIKIAFLGYTYGTNGINLPKGSELVIPLYNDADIDRQTKKAREIADCVIVTIHWGTEDHFKPGEEQKRKAQIMINNGVDVILGHHPHVLQSMQWADRPDGGKTLVMYSLGNFLSGMMYSRNMVGGIMGFDIVKAPNGTAVVNPSFIPTVTHYNKNVREFKIYKFSEYPEELQKVHGTHKFEDGKTLKTMRKIIDNAIPAEFLKEDFYKQ